MKILYFLGGMLATILGVIALSLFAGSITVDTYVGEDSYIARITTDPTGYGITLEMLHNRYSEFIEMEVIGQNWLFHFTRSQEGREQRDAFVDILESVKKVEARYFATDSQIFKCKPEYISQIDATAILCNPIT